MHTLRFDGLFRDLNEGQANSVQAGLLCYGWLISKGNKVLAVGHGACARSWGASSNVAEYLGLIEGLDALLDFGVRRKPVKILGDAKSIIDQMTGRSCVSSEVILPLYRRAKSLSEQFAFLRWDWTPRKENRDADELTRHALRKIYYVENNLKKALDIVRSTEGKGRKSKSLLHIIDLRVYQPVQ